MTNQMTVVLTFKLMLKLTRTRRERAGKKEDLLTVCEHSDTRTNEDYVPLMNANVPIWSESYNLHHQ